MFSFILNAVNLPLWYTAASVLWPGNTCWLDRSRPGLSSFFVTMADMQCVCLCSDWSVLWICAVYHRTTSTCHGVSPRRVADVRLRTHTRTGKAAVPSLRCSVVPLCVCFAPGVSRSPTYVLATATLYYVLRFADRGRCFV